MKRRLGLYGVLLLTMGAMGAGCAGSDGPQGPAGPQGPKGDTGTGTPSVSAVSPPYAFLGRTVDLTVAGSGTSWSSATTVSFTDPKVTVNSVTAASATGLLVNVTIDPAADTTKPTDVTVADGGTSAVWRGAFQVMQPLVVSIDQTNGVPQGGLAAIHVQMLDITTPFDADTAVVNLSSSDLATGAPTVTDYGMDFIVEADVLAAVGSVDLDVQSGATNVIDSPAAKAFMIAARAPTTLAATTPGTGMIQSATDTALFSFTPGGADLRFVQFTVSSMAGLPKGFVLPKDGKYADALDSFGIRFADGFTSTDTLYAIVADAGLAATPYDYSLAVLEVPCTGATETTESAGSNNDAATTAQAVSALPSLVSGQLGYGSVDPASDVDYYSFTVSGATAMAPKTIHIATGGDGLTDAIVTVFDSTGTNPLGQSTDDDFQQDLAVTGITQNGTYYVAVTSGDPNYFNPADNTYKLFIDVK